MSHSPTRSAGRPDGTVLLLDGADEIRRKVLGAVTDSGREVYFDPEEKPGISNLLEIAAGLSGESREAWAERYRTAGYGTFKRAVAEVVVEETSVVRTRTTALLDHPEELNAILRDGQERALVRSSPKVRALKNAIGYPLAD